MSELIITRGLPASGKTTHARAWVRESLTNRIRLNRDETRRMLHGDTERTTNGLHENLITKIHQDTARQALRAGNDVIVDDTNLRGKTATEWATLAATVGAKFTVVDLTNINLDEALKRNQNRPFEQQVPDEVIKVMHQKFLNGRKLLDPKPRETPESEWTTYIANENRPSAYLVDIDGTVALLGDRDVYDGSRAHLDTVNQEVVSVIYALKREGNRIVYMSGRSDEHQEVTQTWLKENGLPNDGLHMRKAGDHRKDSIVKHELFNENIRNNYHVHGVFDDRNQVVEMWRAIGLTVFQVADGNF